MGKICFFIGHSEIWHDIYADLVEAIENHITNLDVTEFRVGNYGAFDRMAAKAVKEAKLRHPDVLLYLTLPYLPGHGRPLPDMQGFDGSIYPEGLESVPQRLAIPRLNRMMAQDADCIIAYVVHSWGGAAQTLEWAEAREQKGRLTIFRLGNPQK